MKKNIIIFMICLIFLFLTVACKDTEETNTSEIYMPILADADWLIADGSFLNGAQLAIDAFNFEQAQNGLKAKIEVIDDGALYEKGVEMATKIAGDKSVTAVFNLQNFDVSKTTASILSDSGKIVVFPYGVYDSILQKEDFGLFCTVASFSDLGKAMASYARENGYKRIAIYHNGKQSQEELVKAFEIELLDSDTKVVDYIPAISSTSEFEKIYERWTALDVDCVVIAQYGLEEAFNVLKTIRDKDSQVPIIGEPIFNRANALEEYKDEAEGMIVPSTLVIDENDRLRQFKKIYLEHYGRDADIWAVQGYDMVRMITDTAAKLGTNDSALIAKALYSEGYHGIGHFITFNESGALVVDVDELPMLICNNGMFEEMKK